MGKFIWHQVLKAKEAKKNAAAAPASKKDKFVGNSATATVRAILYRLFFYAALAEEIRKKRVWAGWGLPFTADLYTTVREDQA